MSIEHRKEQRIKKTLFTQYRQSDGGQWDLAEIKDISKTGLVIKTERIFEVDTILHFNVKLPSNPFLWCEFDARVVKCGNYKVRVEITKIDTSAKNLLDEYITWFINNVSRREQER